MGALPSGFQFGRKTGKIEVLVSSFLQLIRCKGESVQVSSVPKTLSWNTRLKIRGKRNNAGKPGKRITFEMLIKDIQLKSKNEILE